MAAHYLEFERPIGELETKIDELSRLSETAGHGTFDSEIGALRDKLAELRRETYAHLDAWQKTQIARHPQRPHFTHYVARLIEEFVELRGDRAFADDQAIMGGLGRFRGRPVVVIGQEKGHDTTTRIKHNFGAARPEGFRKAARLMDLAEQFGLPVLSFIDTGGAYPGIGSEERGVAEAIARATERCLTLATPMICIIIGEGMSGGAIGIAAANKVLILEHSIYAVISPEGCASILLRDGSLAEGAAKAMKITAEDLIGLGIVDRIIPEPLGGAHADPTAAIDAAGAAIEEELAALTPLSADALRTQRAERFLAIGRSR
jgi:acetyl-CoA carboxylase carboxyl transferase subunit alpha